MTGEINRLILDRIRRLLLQNQETYRIDLHLHTEYSSDGVQTVSQAIKKAKEKHFDIISISDHDTIDAYEEIFKNNLFSDASLPIIIPGVEFTASFPEYCGRCHVLKYLYDINDMQFRNNLKQNIEAFNNRIKMWFESISKNLCLQYFFSIYDISCSEEQYRLYLSKHGNPIPDYANLMEYLFSLLKMHGIGVWDVYNKMVEINQNDPSDSRRYDMKQALNRFYQKYSQQDINNNYRKLRPILAPLGIIDTHYPEHDPLGSISVDEFGQVSIKSLVNSGANILAHPDADKLYIIKQFAHIFDGLELNAHSAMDTNQKVNQVARDLSLVATCGSDKHVDTDEYYTDMDFYDIHYCDLQKLYRCLLKTYEL